MKFFGIIFVTLLVCLISVALATPISHGKRRNKLSAYQRQRFGHGVMFMRYVQPQRRSAAISDLPEELVPAATDDFASDPLDVPTFAVAPPTDDFVPSIEDTSADESVEQPSLPEVPPEDEPETVEETRPVIRRVPAAKAASPSGGSYFPIDFGGTSGGAIAVSNSYSTGEGGSATSHSTAHGSPGAARFRAHPDAGPIPARLRKYRRH